MSAFARRILVGVLFCAMLGAGSNAQGWHHLGNVQHVEVLPDGAELTAGAAKVRITAFRDGVVRVRIAPQGKFPEDFSWAVIQSPQTPAVKVQDGPKEVRITAGDVNVVVSKSPLLINFVDSTGAAILEDQPTLPMAWDGESVHIWKRMPADENYFGLGDKAGRMNRRNRSFTMWILCTRPFRFLSGCATARRMDCFSITPIAAASISEKNRRIIFRSEPLAAN
jgi:alpha-glucosidase (family GH31 glycosyl hydrolase)